MDYDMNRQTLNIALVLIWQKDVIIRYKMVLILLLFICFQFRVLAKDLPKVYLNVTLLICWVCYFDYSITK
jgi:hypothetical protein